MKRELNTVDLFCGAGGASTGMELALARLGLVHTGLAINHWNVAVDTMRANHPCIDTKKMSIAEAVPADLVPGGVVDLLWASPSCTHHSRAKGGKPRDRQLRSQPELVLTWLDQLYVRRLIIENVPEFVQWGPLDENKKPDKSKVRIIEARRVGGVNLGKMKIGSNFKAWIESIKARNYSVQWSIVNCADYGDATSRKRFFLKAVRRGCGRIAWPEPTHAKNPGSDLLTLTRKKWRGAREFLDLSDTGRSIFGRKNPLSKNTMRKIAVGMAQYNGIFLMDMLGTDGNDADFARRCHGVDEPLPTQHAGGNRFAVVRPFIVRLNRNCFAESVDEPLFAVSAGGQHHVLCSPLILDHFKNGTVADASEPIGAQTTHDRYSVVTPFLVEHTNNGKALDIRGPLGSQTTKDHFSICTPLVLGQQSGASARPISEPCPTIATAGAVRVVTPVIMENGDELPRLPDGRYLDIRIRMLKPSELAAAHSFPKDYVLTGNRTDQVKQIGNSVPVLTACAMCEADLAAYAS